MDKMTKDNRLHEQFANSMLAGANADYLEALYEQFLRDPNSVGSQWRIYFEVLRGSAHETAHSPIKASLREQSLHHELPAGVSVKEADLEQYKKQSAIHQLIEGFRIHGHRHARIDPLKMRELPKMPELDYRHHGLSESDMDCMYDVDGFSMGGQLPLRELIAGLRTTYCGYVGSEYMHIMDMTERRWIQHRLESSYGQLHCTEDVKQRLLDRVTVAEGLERYLHARYVGQKRFSLEGAESMIVMLDELIRRSASHGTKEVVIGMAHRGRLNVLVNIMGKTPADLFQEFEGKISSSEESSGTGDVKYHMGFSSNIATPDGEVHVALAFNPSHLEIVSPVVEGSVRARQDRRLDKEGRQVVPIIIHGDAAFSGQGVVMETFNMSQSRGFSTKGTVHIVVNNQIGFTTSNQKDARSTLYSTDVAKIVNAPIFHVNGDDLEAVLFVTQIALDYRMTFQKDVVIDLVCYRRHGHSEADEPAVTQPLMYQQIKLKPSVREIYTRQLMAQGVFDKEEADQQLIRYRDQLDAGLCVVPEVMADNEGHYAYEIDWTPYQGAEGNEGFVSGVSAETMRHLWKEIDVLPESFAIQSNVQKILNNRRKMAAGGMPADWGFAETMAYASLVDEGFGVRLSGQDCGRGTFFHRHAVLHNQNDDSVFVPLRQLGNEINNFLVINSLLSEEAVLAFEYGYATTRPETLVIWEAQFGDFANNAQVVIDQFISAGEQKWDRLCGLVMFLPHGFEGQGPEHSSARLERYLQLCAQHNMQVCAPTTPAQIFHLLRRQMIVKCRKPLIVMTPKSLLRHRWAVSNLDDFAAGGFIPVIGELDEIKCQDVRRIILCAGKVYYDLLEKRREERRQDVAILRLEQLYPFPEVQLKKELSHFNNAQEFVWCQEEPLNQGAWFSSQHHIRNILNSGQDLVYAGRPFSAAPAVGYAALHRKQLRDLIDAAFG